MATDISAFLAGVPPELLGQVLRSGGGRAKREALEQQVQRGQSLQQMGGQRYSSPWAAALGGLAGTVNAGRGIYEQQQGQRGLEALEEAQTGGREALLGAYTSGMQRTQATAPDVIAPNIGMPDASPEQQALASALRGQQQEGREEGVRRGTAYLGLLSGDEGAQSFGRALMGEGAADLREQSLAQGAERLRQQSLAQQRSAELSERRLGIQENQWKQRQESAEVKAAAKKTADTLQIEEGLRKEVMGNPVTRAYLEAKVAYEKVQRAAAAPSPENDLALIFGYMKVLDPGSVVKQDEFANAQNAAGVPERVRNQWNRMLNGERLGDDQRAGFVASARGQFGAQEATFQQLINAYRGVAQRSGARVDNVLPLGAGAQPPAPEAPAAPTLPLRATPAGTPPAAAPPPPEALVLPDGRRVRRNPDGTYSPE